MADFLPAGQKAVIFLLRQIAILQAGGQPLNLLSQIVRLSVRRQLIPLCGKGVDLILHFDDVLRLELVKDRLILGLLFLELRHLNPLAPAIGNNVVDGRLDRALYFGQIFFRYRPAAGGTGNTGDKGFQNLIFPLVLLTQLLDLGVGLRDLLGELGLILLGPAPGQLLIQSQDISVDLHRTAALGCFVVAGAQFPQLQLHAGAVQTSELLSLQGVQFAVQLVITLRQRGNGLPLGFSLCFGLILLALEVDHTLLLFPNLCTLAF